MRIKDKKTGRFIKQHGDGRTVEYHAWMGMLGRCYRPHTYSYRLYGGRGIKVCDRWKASYENFVADVGRRPGPGYSLDRIDANGNYEPGNCRWATAKEQANNRRYSAASHFETYAGETHTIAEWERKLGFAKDFLCSRLMRGLSFKEAVELPKGKHIRSYRKRNGLFKDVEATVSAGAVGTGTVHSDS